MIAGTTFLSTIVTLALAVTIAAPLVLVILWIRDWKKQRLW